VFWSDAFHGFIWIISMALSVKFCVDVHEI